MIRKQSREEKIWIKIKGEAFSQKRLKGKFGDVDWNPDSRDKLEL